MKKNIQNVQQAIDVSNNVLDLAIIRIGTSRKKITCLEKALDLCSKAKISFPYSKKISIVLFSDTGFCGQFNKCNLEFLNDKICVGKKSPIKTLNLREAINDENLDEFLGENYNLEVYVKNFKSQEFDFFKFPKESECGPYKILQSIDKNFIKLYRKCFMEYCINIAVFNENSYRVCSMNNSLESCKLKRRKLNLEFSKCRQEIINNEISVCSCARKQ